MVELSVFLSSKGITKKMLALPVLVQHRDEIALKIGKDWESLATFIGITSQEVDDIRDTYSGSPQRQRQAMMNRWEQLHGSEATYLKLIEGLEQIGRRDLTEISVCMFMKIVCTSQTQHREGLIEISGKVVGTPSLHSQYPQASKPETLPLRNPLSYSSLLDHKLSASNQYAMGVYGAQSEPAKKCVDLPGKMFLDSLPCEHNRYENAVTRQAAVTPTNQRRISTYTGTTLGQSDLKRFRNNYSGTLLAQLPNTCDNSFFEELSPFSSRHGAHPSANNSPSFCTSSPLTDMFAALDVQSRPSVETNLDNTISVEVESKGKSSLPSTRSSSDTSNVGRDKTELTSLSVDLNDTGDITCTRSQPHFFTHDVSSNPSDVGSGIEIAATIPSSSSSEPVMLSRSSQSFKPNDEFKRKCASSTETQDTDVQSCTHQRRPSLNSSSSVDSNSSQFSSLEAYSGPIQVSERSPGEYHPLSNKRSVRPRCKKCAKLKQESNTLKEKIDKVQSEWDTEREQNTKQVKYLIEELHRQRQDNYELTQRVYCTEVRHREASRTIQKLQLELQTMTTLIKLQEAEQIKLKESYDYCFKTKCELLKVQLQRADSMQCPENTYSEIADNVSRYEQHSGPTSRTNFIQHEPTMNNVW